MDDFARVLALSKKVDGWLTDREVAVLYEQAKHIPDGSVILEIGSWRGRSTIVMALALKAAGKKRTRIYAVDPFTGSSENGTVDTFPDFRDNIKRHGVSQFIIPLRMTSEQARRQWDEAKRIDFLWIDGAHEYEFADMDIVMWTPLLTMGGVVALHDTMSSAGVIKAVDDRIYRMAWFEDVHRIDGITYATKVPLMSGPARVRKRFARFRWRLGLFLRRWAPSFLRSARRG